jgi:hypothetical protein
VTQLPVFVEGKGVKVDDPAYWRRIDELDTLKMQLAIVIRDLNSAQNQFDVQQKNIPPSIRGQNRSDVKYRIGQRKAEAFGLLLEAQKVQSLVDELCAKNGMIDAEEGAEDLIGSGAKLFEQLTHTKQEQIVSPQQGTHISAADLSASPEQALIGVFMTVHALISYLRKRKKQ